MLLFWKVLFTEFIAEMGDKTQLMLIAMTSKYKISGLVLLNKVKTSLNVVRLVW